MRKDVEDSYITFMGSFSFASRVTVDAMMDCSGAMAATDLRMMDDDMQVMDMTAKVMATSFVPAANAEAGTVGRYLCIMVDAGSDIWSEEMPLRIPTTEPYTAMGTYMAVGDVHAFAPMGMMRTLGSITRDGTTVHIPYLTTYDGYNQRIVLSNRGSRDADYIMDFRPEAGVTASDGMYADGMLPGSSTVTLRAMDVVMLEGGNRTAATIVLEANSSDIDVSTIIVNKETRGTDTTVLMAAE